MSEAVEQSGWRRGRFRLVAIPFVDKDGVEDGDQGKNRKPRDHNRDYDGVSIHASVAAIRKPGEFWKPGELALALDLLCPYLRGGEHEEIHFVGGPARQPWAGIEEISLILEAGNRGPLPFQTRHNPPYGTSWNTAKNQSAGWSFSRWAASRDGIPAAGTPGIPYANAGGAVVTADPARAFGREVERAVRRFLEARPC